MESKELAENRLKEFLAAEETDVAGYSKLYNSQSCSEIKVKSQKEAVEHTVADAIDTELERQIQEEFMTKRLKCFLPEFEQDVPEGSPNANTKTKPSPENKTKNPLHTDRSSPATERHGKTLRGLAQSELRGGTRKIISDILEQGRPDYLHYYNEKLKPKEAMKAETAGSAKAITAKISYMGPDTETVNYQKSPQAEACEHLLEKKLEKAKMGKTKSLLTETGLRAIRKAEDAKSEFFRFKEFVKGDGNNGINTSELSVLRRKKEAVLAAQTVGGSVTTHLGVYPLRYQYNTMAKEDKKFTNFRVAAGNDKMKPDDKSPHDAFLQRVETHVLDMHQVWHSKQ